MSKRVFVSYSDHDRAIVETIVSRLEADGVSCWVAYRDVAWKDYRDAIVEAIEESDWFLLVFSQTANDSEHVGREIFIARDRRKTVIPVRIEDTKPTNRMEYDLAGWQWLEYWKNAERSLDKLSRLLGGERKVTTTSMHNNPSKPGLLERPVSQKVVTENKGSALKVVFTGGLFVVMAVLVVMVVLFTYQDYKRNADSSHAEDISSTTINRSENRDEAENSAVKQYRAGEVFRDCDFCPEMVVIPAGEFLMGSLESEDGSNEHPQHQVSIQQFAIGRAEVTVGEFKRFVEATSYKTDAEKTGGCYGWNGEAFQQSTTYSWKNVGFDQLDNHPAVCISWNDAQEYAQWLNSNSEMSYRLPSETEFEYVLRASNRSVYPWGNEAKRGCDFANLRDGSYGQKTGKAIFLFDCEDGYAFTAPVKSFKQNSFSIFDVSGNAWEWTEDCWHKNYDAAPTNGAAWLENDNGDCSRRVLRGGGWDNGPDFLRSASRDWDSSNVAFNNTGFRLARSL